MTYRSNSDDPARFDSSEYYIVGVNLLIVAFVAATACVARLPELPESALQVAMGLLGLILVFFRRAGPIGAFLIGIVYASVVASHRLDNRLPTDLSGDEFLLEGIVWSLPVHQDGVQRFRFRCANCWTEVNVNLSVYDGDLLVHPGDHWQFPARLHRPRGLVNPGLFDYDGWLLAHDIAATGYVLADGRAVRVKGASYEQVHHRVRAGLRTSISDVLRYSSTVDLVIALTLGDGAGISRQAWETLSNTGTNHLLVISGLHVGLVAAGSLLLASGILRMFGKRHSRMAFIVSFACACIYGALAGFGLPVQRALIMTGVALWSVLRLRQISLVRTYCLALLGVTLLDPFASLSAGFWLSFGAVGLLLYGFGGRVDRVDQGGMRRWLNAGIKAQSLVFLGMAPIMLVTVNQLSLVAFVANLIAIPWISALVIPVLLVACILLSVDAPGAHAVLRLGDFLLFAIWRLLESFAERGVVYRSAAIDPHIVGLAILGVVTMLAPRGLFPRWPGMLMLLPIFVPVREVLPEGSVELSVLDVGQGLAVVIRTPNRIVLYDTGPRYGDRFDTGRQIVTPYLKSKGVAVIDAIVLSHGDVDHAGGLGAVEEAFIVDETRGSSGLSCREPSLLFDGAVRMEILGHPDSGSKNDRSCMLMVGTDGFSVLLPGDIEAAGEAYLVAMHLPEIDLILAPHHGSASSSGPGFLNQVKPDFAVFSTGYGNRFGHPNDNVVRRYQLRGVRTFTTAEDGAIVFTYQPGESLSITRTRSQERRFWYD